MLVLILSLYSTYHILNLSEKVCLCSSIKHVYSLYLERNHSWTHQKLFTKHWMRSTNHHPHDGLHMNSSVSNSQSGGMSDVHLLFSTQTRTKFSLFSSSICTHFFSTHPHPLSSGSPFPRDDIWLW